MDDEFDPVQKLKRDLRKASSTMTSEEARFLVDSYYIMQETRKRSENQVRALSELGEPHLVIQYFAEQSRKLENQTKSALGVYSLSRPIGEWSRSVVGIGPVIAAGLMAHIDLEPWRCRNKKTKVSCRQSEPCTPECGVETIHTVGHIWRFAGLDPTMKWEKKTRRPWNAALKTLCWKIGESFVKVCNKDDAHYGIVYVNRKTLETERNERGDFAGQAAEILKAKNIGKTTDAYKAYIIGKLPPAHIHARAKRYAVKLFLSHWHHMAYRFKFGIEPPKPYVIDHLKHVNFIPPFNS